MQLTLNECFKKWDNGFFDREFCWNIDAIAGENANGYIVQKIERKTTASESFWEKNDEQEGGPFFHCYYEAWKVENGKIVHSSEEATNNQSFDDCWGYNDKRMISMARKMYGLAESYRTCGEIHMIGTVYWFSEDEDTVPILEKALKKGAVSYAGKLLSSWKLQAIECKTPIGSHELRVAWDLSTDEKFIDAVKTAFNGTSKEQIRKDIDTFFKDLPVYDELKRKILP